MKNRYCIFGCLAALMGLMGCLYSCTDELEGVGGTSIRPTDVICFTASLSDSRSASVSRSASGCLEMEQEEWLVGVDAEQGASRGAPVTLLKDSAGVIGYAYDKTQTAHTTLIQSLENKLFVFDGDELVADSIDVRWKTITGDSVLFYVYAPYQGNDNLTYAIVDDTLALKDIMVNDDVAKQQDLIVASWQGKKGKNYGNGIQTQSIPLTFEHALTGVKFKVGFECIVTKLEVKGISKKGTYTFGKGWSVDTGVTKDYIFSFDNKSCEANTPLTDGENTLLMIPQTLQAGAQAILYYRETADGQDKTITASLENKVWQPGKMITYTIHNGSAPQYIYLDLAAGNVLIDATKYQGSYFQTTTGSDGNKTTKKVEIKNGVHQSGNNYYIYQSTTTNRSTTGKIDGFFVLPIYKEVTIEDNGVKKTWSDYITNNTNVQKVIEAWDNAAGAGQATADNALANVPNQSGAAGAVRNVGREATKNRIHITGNVGEVNLSIDNIYSSYQERGAVPVRTRTQGGISFIPSWTDGNSVLTINIIGDNRLGCVNYQNNYPNDQPNENWLVFEGTGSLTVGDVDYFRDSSGLGSNRSCSVIGGKDEIKDEEDVYNIKINSGVIYAGAVPSSCTAIGGGGNGNTNIEINGGTITAVAKTTGTAIGGGTGLVQPGGIGKVTINAGNIYAYNYKNTSNVPSSAIGGAGSQDVDGSLGEVFINGGYVYAYSQYGTAIGGGSSQKTIGGNAEVTITGGQVIAKSDNGAGIGGGSACMGGQNSTSNKYDGGTAKITISGNPIVRTGSIGGGSTNDPKGGKIGSADITINDGDIQTQFVMAAGAKATPSFTMSGGTIRNSYTDDEEYKHTKDQGGAVYLEDGTFKMTGGIIKNCSAEQGGAVYIAGSSTTTFTMEGGEIHSCFATGKKNENGVVLEHGHGGAVCLNGGVVQMSGGRIWNNYSENGNGGAIYINNGNFSMDDTAGKGLPRIDGNSAQKGDGGGVFVSSAGSAGSAVEVDLLQGIITNNTANNYGGGVCVDMGNTDHAATVIAGVTGEGATEATAKLKIHDNASMMAGGGLYVRGVNANITINSGMIDKNKVSAYVRNENVANEDGEVLLNAGQVTHVVVTFKGNGGTSNGSDEYTQKIVTNTNSKLQANSFSRNGYEFAEWNTRADGAGTSYSNKQLVNISEPITLYAKWRAK